MKRWALAGIGALLIACGGSDDGDGGGSDLGGGFDFGGGGGDTGTGTVIPGGDPISPDWQYLYGYYSQGATYDQEGVVSVLAHPSGGVLAFADRRYNDDPYGNTLLLTHTDEDGTLQSALRLQFDGLTAPRGLEPAPFGDWYVVVESAPLVARIGDAGELRWSMSLAREPYAFGGMTVTDSAVDASGNLYLVGAFSPSEGGDERGFVMQLDANGAVQWTRSWGHDVFFEGLRVAASEAGVFVIDRVPGQSEIDTRRALLGFTPDGATIGQTAFLMDSFDGPVGALQQAAVAITDDGLVVVGTRSFVRDGGSALFVYEVRFDENLGLVGESGTRIPTESLVTSRSLRLARGGAGDLIATGWFGEHGGAIYLGAGDGPARLYTVEREDGSPASPFDEDYPMHAAPGPGGSVYLGGTATAPGDVTLRPWDTAAATLPLDLVDAGLTIFEDDVTASDAALVLNAAADAAGESDAPEEGDQDIWLLRVTLE